MKRKREESGEQAGINLMPVLSVAFLLLLFFVVAVPFMGERGIDFSGAECDCPRCERGPLVITVDSRSRIFAPGRDGLRQLEVRAVKNYVARALADGSNCTSVAIQAHPKSDMGVVIRIADEAGKARGNPRTYVSIHVTDR